MAASTAILSSKGQIVIPAELRQEMELEAGTRFVVTHSEGKIVLQPVEHLLGQIRGMFKGSGISEIREREHKKDKW